MIPTIHFVFNLLDYSFGDSNGKSVRIEIEERPREERITKGSFQSCTKDSIESARFGKSVRESIGETNSGEEDSRRNEICLKISVR